jgi:small subunit ribosomal protein S2
MVRVPDVVVIIDIRREHNAVRECEKLGLPIISMLDTNCNPDVVNWPIPANDDAIRSIKLIVGKLADAIYEGRHGKAVSEERYDEFDDSLEEVEYEEDYEDQEEYDRENSPEGEEE